MRLGSWGYLLGLVLAAMLSACGSVDSDNTTDDGGESSDFVGDGEADGDGAPDVEDDADADGSLCETGEWCEGVGCVDTDTDPLHCGTCDNECPDGLNADAACAGGACALDCREGWVDVDGSPGCEYSCTPTDPPTEACNGLDDDCDGSPDDSFECVFGATESCTTTCSTTGTRHCGGECTWTCTPPLEACDGLDQDCDGVADDGPYAVLWDQPAVEPPTGRTILGFSIAVQFDEVGVAYVRSASSGGAVGDAALQRCSVATGALRGTSDALSAGPDVLGLRVVSSPTAFSVAWDTGDDTSDSGEAVLMRSGLLGSSYALYPPAVADTSDTDRSTAVTLIRTVGGDVAFVSWIEQPVAGAQLRLARITDFEAPLVRQRSTIPTSATPANPDIGLHGDSTILVAWSSGSPGQIVARRLNTALELIGDEVVLSAAGSGAGTVPRVASSASRFMVVWQEEGEGVVVASVLPDGTIALAATTLAAAGTRPVIAPDLLGGFAVAYETSAGVEIARVSAAGAIGGPTIVITGAHRPEITSIPEGGLVLAYDAEGTVRLARLGCTP